MKLAWKNNAKDKEKVLDSKRRQLQENWQFTEQLSTKEKTICDLKEDVHSVFERVKEKEESIKNLTEFIEQLKEKHRVEMETQMNFNIANDNSIRRLNERMVDAEKQLKEINLRIKSRLITLGDWDRSIEESIDHIKLSLGEKVKQNLDRLINHFSEIDSLRERIMIMEDERLYILTHIGVDVQNEKTIDIISSFRDFVVNNEEAKQSFSNEIEALTSLINVHRKSSAASEVLEMNVAELQRHQKAMQGNIQAKEERVNVLSRENDALKITIKNLESELSKLKQSKSERGKSAGKEPSNVTSSPTGKHRSWQNMHLESISTEHSRSTPRLLIDRRSSGVRDERETPECITPQVNEIILPMLTHRPHNKHLMIQPKSSIQSNQISDFTSIQGGLTVKSMNSVDKRVLANMQEYSMPASPNGFGLSRNSPRFGSHNRLPQTGLKTQTGLSRQATFHGVPRRTNAYSK